MEYQFKRHEENSGFVVVSDGLRGPEKNLRTRFRRLLFSCGIKPWPKLFQKLSASCETDFLNQFQIHQATSFIGNSPQVALQHYAIGESSSYHRRAIAQIDSIETFLNQYPEKYSNVTIHVAPDGYAYMMGDVKTKEEFELLQTELQRLFGVEVAHEMLWRVDVATPMNQLGQASTIQ